VGGTRATTTARAASSPCAPPPPDPAAPPLLTPAQSRPRHPPPPLPHTHTPERQHPPPLFRPPPRHSVWALPDSCILFLSMSSLAISKAKQLQTADWFQCLLAVALLMRATHLVCLPPALRPPSEQQHWQQPAPAVPPLLPPAQPPPRQRNRHSQRPPPAAAAAEGAGAPLCPVFRLMDAGRGQSQAHALLLLVAGRWLCP
jgi:hypothetical protein